MQTETNVMIEMVVSIIAGFHGVSKEEAMQSILSDRISSNRKSIQEISKVDQRARMLLHEIFGSTSYPLKER